MFRTRGEKVIRSVKRILIGSFLLLVGCSNPMSSEDEATLSFDMRLNKDSNGYYHMNINDGKWQTLHRVSGTVSVGEYGVNNIYNK